VEARYNATQWKEVAYISTMEPAKDKRKVKTSTTCHPHLPFLIFIILIFGKLILETARCKA
jgi:hypothetical protein